MLSTMVTFLFWSEVSVINKSKMAANRHIGFWQKMLTFADDMMWYLYYQVFKVILNYKAII